MGLRKIVENLVKNFKACEKEKQVRDTILWTIRIRVMAQGVSEQVMTRTQSLIMAPSMVHRKIYIESA
jgi:hypothetical protein